LEAYELSLVVNFLSLLKEEEQFYELAS